MKGLLNFTKLAVMASFVLFALVGCNCNLVSCIVGKFFTIYVIREALIGIIIDI